MAAKEELQIAGTVVGSAAAIAAAIPGGQLAAAAIAIGGTLAIAISQTGRRPNSEVLANFGKKQAASLDQDLRSTLEKMWKDSGAEKGLIDSIAGIAERAATELLTREATLAGELAKLKEAMLSAGGSPFSEATEYTMQMKIASADMSRSAAETRYKTNPSDAGKIAINEANHRLKVAKADYFLNKAKAKIEKIGYTKAEIETALARVIRLYSMVTTENKLSHKYMQAYALEIPLEIDGWLVSPQEDQPVFGHFYLY